MSLAQNLRDIGQRLTYGFGSTERGTSRMAMGDSGKDPTGGAVKPYLVRPYEPAQSAKPQPIRDKGAWWDRLIGTGESKGKLAVPRGPAEGKGPMIGDNHTRAQHNSYGAHPLTKAMVASIDLVYGLAQNGGMGNYRFGERFALPHAGGSGRYAGELGPMQDFRGGWTVGKTQSLIGGTLRYGMKAGPSQAPGLPNTGGGYDITHPNTIADMLAQVEFMDPNRHG
jgi:hypothetical protein